MLPAKRKAPESLETTVLKRIIRDKYLNERDKYGALDMLQLLEQLTGLPWVLERDEDGNYWHCCDPDEDTMNKWVKMANCRKPDFYGQRVWRNRNDPMIFFTPETFDESIENKFPHTSLDKYPLCGQKVEI